MRLFPFFFVTLVIAILALASSCDRDSITLTVPVSFDSLQFKVRPTQVGLPGKPRQFATGFREVDTTQLFAALRKMDNRALLKHIKSVALKKLVFSIPAGADGDLSTFDSLQLVSRKPGTTTSSTLAKVPVSAPAGSNTTTVEADVATASTEDAALSSLAGVHSLSLEGSTKEGASLESETTLSTSLDVDMIIELDPND